MFPDMYPPPLASAHVSLPLNSQRHIVQISRYQLPYLQDQHALAPSRLGDFPPPINPCICDCSDMVPVLCGEI